MNVDEPFLSDSVGAVCRLIFNRGIPPSVIVDFQNKEFPILILSLKAGGTGLNLTAANHVIHYDRWWNPAVENQATDRAYSLRQFQQFFELD